MAEALAYKITTTYSDNWMLCESLCSALKALEAELAHEEDVLCLAREEQSYSIEPVLMDKEEITEACNREFPGW